MTACQKPWLYVCSGRCGGTNSFIDIVIPISCRESVEYSIHSRQKQQMANKSEESHNTDSLPRQGNSSNTARALEAKLPMRLNHDPPTFASSSRTKVLQTTHDRVVASCSYLSPFKKARLRVKAFGPTSPEVSCVSIFMEGISTFLQAE